VSSFRKMRWSWVAALGALALILSACPADEPDPEDPVDPDEPDVEVVEDFTYNTGIFEDTRSDNYWAYLDPDSTVWTGYVLGGTKCSLYTITYPAIQVTPNIAAEDVPDAEEQDDGTWAVDVQLRDDVMWSDDEPLTAHDMAFTFEVVQEFALGHNWRATYYPEPIDDDEENDTEEVNVRTIEAVDDHTVRIVFTDEPGLGVWPHGPGVATIMPEHFWADVIDEARGADTEEAQEIIYGASGEGDPSCGSTVFEEWEPDAFARVASNPNYPLSGQQYTQYENTAVDIDGENFGPDPEGDVIAEYTTGPFFDDMVFTLYGAQDSAVLALRQGEVDYLFNPLGLERGLQEPVIEDPDLEVAVNAANGMRYMAFNMRHEPMSDIAFRQALATVVDREFMAETVLGGVAFPMFAMLPAGNTAWYNEDVVEEISGQYMDMDEAERLERAVEILSDAGYTWEQEPEIDEEGAPVPGEGIMMPDGSPMPDLVINSLSPGYDPLRATYGLWIERWAQELGMPVTAQLSGFGPVVDVAFPGGGETPTFDMYILGWSLGNPAFPDFYESFWHSRNDPDPNAPGFETRLWTMRADGSKAKPLPLDQPGFDNTPRYSPNGRWIVFARLHIMSDGYESALFIVRAKGGKVKQLTPWGEIDENPTWSPDSRRIIFAVGPLRARPATMGETATTGAPQDLSKAPMPETARIGSMLMKGFDGQITTASRLSLSSAAPRAGVKRASPAPRNSNPLTFGAHRRSTK
jgi:peptide/nickel transport system substrate-binding protein